MRIGIAILSLVAFSVSAQAQVKIKAVNKLPLARPNQTIELTAKEIGSLSANLMTIRVADSAGNDLVAQAVDTDFDERHRPDIVIFQSDFGPNETKTFTVSVGARRVYKEEQFKVRGRFNRERFDDFAWENDRIAHRMYGKALETWVGEPLTSSTIDIWSKRTPKMVQDKWYMVDDYHVDHGEGADYSAGPSRGVGGTGLWANNQLFVSKNFVQSRVLSNGPIRILFELEYEPFDVAGAKVSEVKRISLDGGSHFDRYQSTYKIVEGAGPLTVGVGLKKVNGEQKEYNAAGGWLAKWEQVEKNSGMQGLAAIVDPKLISQQTEDRRNLLLLVKADNNTITYWAGFCWDKAGQYTDLAAWKKHVGEFAQGVASPIEVSVAP